MSISDHDINSEDPEDENNEHLECNEDSDVNFGLVKQTSTNDIYEDNEELFISDCCKLGVSFDG